MGEIETRRRGEEETGRVFLFAGSRFEMVPGVQMVQMVPGVQMVGEAFRVRDYSRAGF